MKITLLHHGFHGWNMVTFYAGPANEGPSCDGGPDWWEATVSLRTGARLNHTVCGIADCCCGEQIADCNSYRNPHPPNTGFAAIRYLSADGGKTGQVFGHYSDENEQVRDAIPSDVDELYGR